MLYYKSKIYISTRGMNKHVYYITKQIHWFIPQSKLRSYSSRLERCENFVYKYIDIFYLMLSSNMYSSVWLLQLRVGIAYIYIF